MLEDGQISTDFQLENIDKVLLFHRLVEISGVQIAISDSFSMLFALETPFQLEYLRDIEPQVKHIHRISFEEGTALCKYALSKPSK